MCVSDLVFEVLDELQQLWGLFLEQLHLLLVAHLLQVLDNQLLLLRLLRSLLLCGELLWTRPLSFINCRGAGLQGSQSHTRSMHVSEGGASVPITETNVKLNGSGGIGCTVVNQQQRTAF